MITYTHTHTHIYIYIIVSKQMIAYILYIIVCIQMIIDNFKDMQ